jgi:RNA polymerase sigma-70 factor, ECF subfamily
MIMEAVGEAWRRGHDRWPEVRLSREDFAAHVAALRRQGEAPSDDDVCLHGADLFLVTACLTGESRALAAFERDFLAGLARTVSGIDRAPSFGAEVVQQLRERLLCPPQQRLRSYTGAGSLVGWLRVAAKRLALDLKRREGTASRHTEQLASVLVNASRNPEWELVRRRFRQPMEAALGEALDALPPRERMVLRLYLLRKENIAAIGKLYGVHRATVARWIVAAQQSVAAAVTARLGSELGFTASQCRSLARELQSSLELSLERRL